MSAGPELTFAVSPFIGGSLRWYTLIWLAEHVLGYWLLARQVRRGGGEDEDTSDLAVHLWVGVLVGGRLAEGVFYEGAAFVGDPAWVFKLANGGLSGHGAAVGCVVAAALYARRRALPLLDVLDRVTFAAAALAITHRLGTLLNSELVGKVTDGTWGVRFPYFDGELDPPLRHPTPLYELGLGALVFVVLRVADSAWGREARPRGALLGLGGASYFSGRFLLDFFNEPASEGGLLTSQWLSLGLTLSGAAALIHSLRRPRPAGFEMLEGAPSEDDAPSSAT